MGTQRLFSRRVGYAVHALCLLARKDPWSAIPVAELAAQMALAWPGTSTTYLSKVVQALVQGGILVSLRGSAGGYGFARPPAELSLLDVITALEGPLDPSCPLTPSGPCTVRERCRNFDELRQLQHDIANLLAAATIERLARNLPRTGEPPSAGLQTCNPAIACDFPPPSYLPLALEPPAIASAVGR
jgi:Rrf2 family protein